MGLEDVVGILSFDCWTVLLASSSGPMGSTIFYVSSEVMHVCEAGLLKGFVNAFQSVMDSVLGSG